MPILQEQKSAIYAHINSFVACALNVAKEKNPGAQPPRNFPFEGVRARFSVLSESGLKGMAKNVV